MKKPAYLVCAAFLIGMVFSCGPADESSRDVGRNQSTPTQIHSAVVPTAADANWNLVGTCPPKPSSIILISLDTVRAQSLKLYGGRAETPNLEAFAAQGALFRQAITNFPETCLSHWTMMSGVLSELHGNAVETGVSRYSSPTLAEIVRQCGYFTGALIGGLTLIREHCGLQRGFTKYIDQFATYTPYLQYPGRVISDTAVQWIEDQKGPYFLFLHYFDAHFPYTPSPPWDTRYDPDYQGDISGSLDCLIPFIRQQKTPEARDVAHVQALYEGEISQLDGLLAPVLAAADDNTIIIITADHGESFEHDYWFNHADGLWDSVLHVPLLIRAPAIPPGTIVEEQVALLDLTPSILELAGLPGSPRMQGVSFLPLLMGKGRRESHEVFAITDPWAGDRKQFAVRSKNMKLIHQSKSSSAGEAALVYRLAVDPAESNPLPVVPQILAGAQRRYEQIIESYRKYQLPESSPRTRSEEELETLQALGYLQAGKGRESKIIR